MLPPELFLPEELALLRSHTETCCVMKASPDKRIVRVEHLTYLRARSKSDKYIFYEALHSSNFIRSTILFKKKQYL